MKLSSYLLRIDDVCPTMKREPFRLIQAACEELEIKPIIGIIPDNRDATLRYEPAREDFWPLMKDLVAKDWIIAQHGYQHVYGSKKTEFAGLSYKEQHYKISQGKQILAEKLGITPTWFMAPGHSLDRTTCKALAELTFTHITDGIALYPYLKDGLVWVPQQLWQPVNLPIGLWTICLHPSTMSTQEIEALLRFLRDNAERFHNISVNPRTSILNTPMQLLWKAALLIKKL